MVDLTLGGVIGLVEDDGSLEVPIVTLGSGDGVLGRGDGVLDRVGLGVGVLRLVIAAVEFLLVGLEEVRFAEPVPDGSSCSRFCISSSIARAVASLNFSSLRSRRFDAPGAYSNTTSKQAHFRNSHTTRAPKTINSAMVTPAASQPSCMVRIGCASTSVALAVPSINMQQIIATIAFF